MKECLKRALRTFVQAAFGYLAANFVIVIQNINGADKPEAVDMITMLIASTVAAGLAAVMNISKKTPHAEDYASAVQAELSDDSESTAHESVKSEDASENAALADSAQEISSDAEKTEGETKEN